MQNPSRKPEHILQRLDWTVVRRLDGLLQGDYRTFFQGFGLDLADLKEYQFADDVRCIDWNVTARMQEPHVRRYLEDREMTAWFLVDLSPSVDFGTVNTRKRDLVVEFTAVLARMLTRRGNRVGAIIYDGFTPRLRPASGGRLQVLQLIRDIQDRPLLPRAPETDLSVLLDTASRVIRRRSLLMVVSDFYSLPGWERSLGAICRRHEVLGVRIFDPRETELPEVGPVWFEDSETGEQLFIDTDDRAFKERFTEAVQKADSDREQAFAAHGIDALSLSTEKDMVKEILSFSARRKKRRAAPASYARRTVHSATAGGRK
jgi:uncharacterized protein (DUF58 family)